MTETPWAPFVAELEALERRQFSPRLHLTGSEIISELLQARYERSPQFRFGDNGMLRLQPLVICCRFVLPKRHYFAIINNNRRRRRLI